MKPKLNILTILLFSLISCNYSNNSTNNNSTNQPHLYSTKNDSNKVRLLTNQEIQDSTKSFLDVLKKEDDAFKDVVWYKPKSFVHYNNSNLISLYMGVSSDMPFLRLIMSYDGDDWIFFEEALLNYDGKTLDIPFNKYENKNSDNDGGRVWEWIDVPVNDEILAFLEEFAKSPSAKMRLSGKYYEDRNVSNKEKREILNMIKAYNKLNYYKKLKIEI